VTDSDAAANEIAENAANGTVVGVTALATDADGTDTVTYSLSDDAGGLFTIDANTGVITVANALDYETATSHSVTVLATSSDTSISSQNFTINVTDINKFVAIGAVSDNDESANTVTENALVGDTVGITALATDADGTDTVTYSLSDDAGGLFTIDANTGVITVANALDYETATSHSVTVLATSSDTSTSSQAFTINVTDVNESAIGAVSDINATANTVAEDAVNGTVVGITALATDADGTDTVTYSLSDDAGGLFTIDANTGVVTIASALDYETAMSHNITVLATSDDTSTASQVFSITVSDVNDDTPVDDSNADDNGDTITATDPLVENPDPIEEAKIDDLNLNQDDPAEDTLLDEEPQGFEDATNLQDSAETDNFIALQENSETELTEDVRDWGQEIRAGSQHERPENDRSYSYFDNNLYKEILSDNYLDFHYKALNNVLDPDEFDDFSTIDFESDDLDKVVANGEYDLLRQEIDESFNAKVKSEAVKTKLVTMTIGTFTVGIVSYLLRAGSLVASLMSTLPLWRGFDPIVIFTGDKKKRKEKSELPDTDELNPDSLFDGDAK
jgi:hypothetical protein